MRNLFSNNLITSPLPTLFLKLFFLIFMVLSIIGFALFTYTQNAIFLYFFVSLFILTFITLSLFCCWLLNHLNKRNAVIKDIFDAIPEPVVIKDSEGKYLFCNKFLATFYDTKAEKMSGKEDVEFTGNKEESEFFKASVKKVIKKFKPEIVHEILTDIKTGNAHHYQSYKVPFLDRAKKENVIIFAQEITELSILKDNVNRAKKRLEDVLDVSQEALWEWNTRDNTVLHNKWWDVITGVKQSDGSFEEFQRCILEEDKSIVNEALTQLLQENKPYNIEFRMKRPDGKVIWVWDRGIVAELDDNGKALWVVGLLDDITEKKYNQEKVESLAYYDALTNLPNRVLLDKELKIAVEDSYAKERYGAVLFFDLDRFKFLNDTYGHHMGDRLLIQVADRLQNMIKGHGIVARFGGDEFVAILSDLDSNPEIATDQAQAFAEKIRKKVSEVIHLSSEIKDISIEYAITTSIGGVIFKSPEITPDRLLQLADLALYHVKNEGKDGALIFDLNMQKELDRTSSLKKSMQNALENGDFCIYLQGKYCQQKTLIGAEALIRWNHPEYGFIPPLKLIGIAEEINLIVRVGNFVLHQACTVLKKWQSDHKTEHLTLAVNLSAQQIWQEDFTENIISIIEQYNLDHTKLILEITESVLLQDINDAIEKLFILKDYGLYLSLDDFGTGYSSLSYLKSLPIDEIKIDKSFVNDIIDDPQAAVMVKSILDLGNNFNLNIVSEGVETEKQFKALIAYGIDVYQGFYFTKPINLESFEQLLIESDS